MTDSRSLDGTGHPDDVLLVRFLDHELPPLVSVALERHADECADCRTRIRNFQRAFHEFGAASALLRDSPATAIPLDTFSARLRETVERQASARWARRRYWRRAGGVAASIVAAAALLWTSMAGVSAETVLARAEVRELIDVRMADAVVASTIEIRRVATDRSSTRAVGRLAIVDDYVTTARHVTIETGPTEAWRGVVTDSSELIEHLPWHEWFAEPLAEYARRAAWVPDVSVAAYRQLARAGEAGATVRNLDGDREVRRRLRPNHPARLSEIALRIDGETGLPRALQLVTVDGDGYVISRANVRHLERGETVRALLSRPPVVATAPAAPRRARVAAAPRRLSYADSVATSVEVAAIHALHAAGADLGEEVAVVPMSDGSVVIEGLVSTHGRAAAVSDALRGLPRVRSTVTAADAPGVTASPARPAAIDPSIEVRIENLATAALPILELVETQGRCDPARVTMLLPAGAHDVAAYSTFIVEHSTTALVHAWALERLLRQFDARRSAALDARARQMLAGVVEAHRAGARAALDAVRARLTPLAAACAIVIDATPVGRSEDHDLPALAREQNRLVRQLFTRGQSTAAPDRTLRALITVLQRLG